MNKKLIVIIVFLVVVFSVVIVAVYGSEPRGGQAYNKATGIRFVKDDGKTYYDLNNATIHKDKNKSKYTIKWTLIPENVENQKITVSNSKPDLVQCTIEEDTIVVMFLEHIDVLITITHDEVPEGATITFTTIEDPME